MSSRKISSRFCFRSDRDYQQLWVSFVVIQWPSECTMSVIRQFELIISFDFKFHKYFYNPKVANSIGKFIFQRNHADMNQSRLPWTYFCHDIIDENYLPRSYFERSRPSLQDIYFKTFSDFGFALRQSRHIFFYNHRDFI